jgi:hypothetical protein
MIILLLEVLVRECIFRSYTFRKIEEGYDVHDGDGKSPDGTITVMGLHLHSYIIIIRNDLCEFGIIMMEIGFKYC